MEDPERQWEVHDGLLRETPGVGMEHNDVMFCLGVYLHPQLDGSKFRIRVNSARLRLPTGGDYISDLVVVPTDAVLSIAGRPGELEFHNRPVPLVAEMWSRPLPVATMSTPNCPTTSNAGISKSGDCIRTSIG